MIASEDAESERDDTARIAALIEQIEALAGDNGITKIAANQRAQQTAIARLSRWRQELVAAGRQAAASRGTGAAAAATAASSASTSITIE